MAYNFDVTAVLKAGKQENHVRLAGFQNSRDMTCSFKDSLKEAVRDKGFDERKNGGSAAPRKDLVNRAEAKLNRPDKHKANRAEAGKPMEEDSENKTDKVKKTMEELLSKLEKMAAMQQGEIPAEKYTILLESIKEILKELEAIQGSNTAAEQAGLQSKTTELAAELETMLKVLKNEGSLVKNEADSEFLKELEALVSKTFAKLEDTSEASVGYKTAGPNITEKSSNINEISPDQAAAGNNANKSETYNMQEKTDGQKNGSKLASGVTEKQQKSTEAPEVEAEKANKAAQPEADETAEEVKAALDSKVEKAASEGKENRKQDADAENSKETSQQVPKAVNTAKHKQVNEEIAAIKLEQVAADKQANTLQLRIPAQKSETVSKAEIINQIVKKAEVIVTDARQEMRMQLEPENLGKLTLKLAVEKGLITAKFVAESHEVKQVIESSLNELRDMLQDKGLNVQNFSVSVGQDNKEYSNENAMYQWKETVRLNSRSLNRVNYDGYQTGEAATVRTANPYSIHNGIFDHRA